VLSHSLASVLEKTGNLARRVAVEGVPGHAKWGDELDLVSAEVPGYVVQPMD
jgi:hypothetical protein